MQTTPRAPIEPGATNGHLGPVPSLERHAAPGASPPRRSWAMVGALVAAFAAVALAVGLFFAYQGAVNDRDDAIAQADAAQVEATAAQGSIDDLEAQVSDLEAAQGDLNTKVDACQSAFKTESMVFSGKTRPADVSFAKFLDDVSGCYGSVPPWME